MMKLIRLAVYALVGYAAYHFFTEVLNRAPEAQPARASSGGSKGRGGRKTAGGSRARSGSGATARITGRSKAGKVEETMDNDGGAVRHRVGRGVVES